MASGEHVRSLYARYAADADACIVEGIMGMFDGYDRDKGSSEEIAKLLHLPVILVVDARSAAYSMAPLLSGFIHFRPEVRIAGVIFNKISSPRHYEMLQEVCADLNVTCLGYLPKKKDFEQESRHLGLNFRTSKVTSPLEELTEALEQHVDWQLLLEKTTLPLPETSETVAQEPGKLRITVACTEESFSFIYEEHLDILRRLGTVTFFNPEHNRPNSQKTDLLYLPGGCPEECAEELSQAWRARESVRKYIEAGGRVLAECGGMIYLANQIIYSEWEYEGDLDGYADMVGIFPFDITNEKEDRKLTLGYRQFDYSGQHLRGHEFHYTQFYKYKDYYDECRTVTALPPSVAQVFDAKGRPVGTPVFRYKNVIASYTHLYWGETDIMKLFEL